MARSAIRNAFKRTKNAARSAVVDDAASSVASRTIGGRTVSTSRGTFSGTIGDDVNIGSLAQQRPTIAQNRAMERQNQAVMNNVTADRDFSRNLTPNRPSSQGLGGDVQISEGYRPRNTLIDNYNQTPLSQLPERRMSQSSPEALQTATRRPTPAQTPLQRADAAMTQAVVSSENANFQRNLPLLGDGNRKIGRNRMESVGLAAGQIGRNAWRALGEGDNLRNAGIRTFQSAAAGAMIGGTAETVQGGSFFDGAGRGAFRGAVAGAGYQGLRLGTGTTATGFAGARQAASRAKSVYQSRDLASLNRMGSNQRVSRQVSEILDLEQGTRAAAANMRKGRKNAR